MLPEYVKFYYDRLPQTKKDIYMQMYRGLREHKKRITISADTSVFRPEDLHYIFRCLYNDTPSFYFVDPTNHKVAKTSAGYVLIRDFLYEEDKIKEYDEAIMKGLKAFRDRYIREDMSDYEKEVVIHDYLVRTVVYDESSAAAAEQEIIHKEIFNVLGALLRKKAVCWGISCAFKLLCDYCRVKCFVIVGNLTDTGRLARGHAWNIVRLEDENYHVDVTWDIKEKGDISFIYDYLNLNDHLIRMDHSWNDGIYPVCKALKYNYYHRNKLYVRSLEQIPEFIRKHYFAGETYITFKYANDMPPAEEIREKVNQGLYGTDFSGNYQWSVIPETHNVYLELHKR